MIKLDDITLLSVVGANKYIEPTIRAMKYSINNIDFKSVKLLTCSIVDNTNDIEQIKIPALSHEEYTEFMIYELPQFIDTEFCITIQHDGFIINPTLWSEDFLKYDYIGAPWIGWHINNVGNGGFSLRSKKFLSSAKTLKYNSKIQFQAHIPAGELITPEDWFVCNYSYYNMLKMGVKFPNIFQAYKFAVEHPSNIKQYNRNILSTYNSFGFHGDFNIAAMELVGENYE